jgi:molybdopterin synthase sulfur carrier subunit
MASIDILYFGELRQAIGMDGERADPPTHVLTLEDLVNWLSERGAPYDLAFAERDRLCGAVDREHATLGDSFFGAQEVALFPPVSGT